jgi:hypothetical protein
LDKLDVNTTPAVGAILKDRFLALVVEQFSYIKKAEKLKRKGGGRGGRSTAANSTIRGREKELLARSVREEKRGSWIFQRNAPK